MSEQPAERDSFRWNILALITLSHIIGASAQYGINTLGPFYKDDLGLTRAQVGLFFSSFYLAMTGFSFFAGKLADRLGVRQTTLQGHLAVGVCTFAAALMPSFTWGCISFFLAGLGYAFLNPSSSKGVMAWFHRDERATAMGTKQTGVPAGGVVTAMLAPQLVLLMGWRGALAALGVINFFFGFLFSFWWREPDEKHAPEEDHETAAQEANEPLSVWKFLPISVGTGLYLIGQMSLITYVPLYLKDSMGFSAYWASQALALTQGGAVIGRIGWGVASDKLFGGRRKIVLVLIGICSALLTTALGWMTPQSPVLLVMVILFLAGVSLVGYQGVSYALAGELAGKARAGQALGMMITFNAAAATLGTPLFGYIVDRTGSYPAGWFSLAAAITAGVIGLALLLEEPKRSR